MDRGRRAELYGNATIWTREVARNLAHHLERISKAHSCVDTSSPKCAKLPQFQHKRQRSFANSPMRTKQVSKGHHHSGDSVVATATQTDLPCCDDPDHLVAPTDHAKHSHGNENNNHEEHDQELHLDDLPLPPALSKEPLHQQPPSHSPAHRSSHDSSPTTNVNAKRQIMEHERQEAIEIENRRLRHRLIEISRKPDTTLLICSDGLNSFEEITSDRFKRSAYDSNRKREIKNARIWEENQLMVKRLRNAKPTINSEEITKDDKWNQSFQKSQERRRNALHQEMKRIQSSPQAAIMYAKQLTRKAAKQKKNRVLPVEELAFPTTPGGSGLRTPPRSPPAPVKVLTPFDELAEGVPDTKRVNDDVAVRRDTMSKESNGRRHRTHHRSRVETPAEVDISSSSSSLVSQQENELVSYRFTFSREKEHRHDPNDEQTEFMGEHHREDAQDGQQSGPGVSSSKAQPSMSGEQTTPMGDVRTPKASEEPAHTAPPVDSLSENNQQDHSGTATDDRQPRIGSESVVTPPIDQRSPHPVQAEATIPVPTTGSYQQSEDADHKTLTAAAQAKPEDSVSELTAAASSLTLSTGSSPTCDPPALQTCSPSSPKQEPASPEEHDNSYGTDEFENESTTVKSPPRIPSPTIASQSPVPQSISSAMSTTRRTQWTESVPTGPATVMSTATMVVTAAASVPEYENEFEEDDAPFQEEPHPMEAPDPHQLSYSNDDFVPEEEGEGV